MKMGGLTHIKLLPVNPILDPFHFSLIIIPTPLLFRYGRNRIKPVRMIRRPILPTEDIPLPVSLSMREWAHRLIHWDLAEIDPNPRNLSVEVGEVPACQQRVIGKVHTGDDMLSAKGDLLNFGKVVCRCTVQCECADVLHGDKVFRDELGRVEQVKVELVGERQMYSPRKIVIHGTTRDDPPYARPPLSRSAHPAPTWGKPRPQSHHTNHDDGNQGLGH